MKKTDFTEKYDRSRKILLYEADDSGRVSGRAVKPEIAGELVDEYYSQREKVWSTYKKKLLEGSASPIQLYMEYNHMTPRETAAMVGISVSKLRKHMTMEGFLKADVNTLKSYARVFNVPVCSFFQLLEYSGDLALEARSHHDGLIQELTVSPRGPKEKG
jgi:hypothetical protein